MPTNRTFKLTVSDDLWTAWHERRPVEEILTRFVVETASRAAGLWRLEEQHLVLVGFGWARDMSEDVAMGFQEATRRVPISRTDLGIVKAIVTEQPTIGLRDAHETGLVGSATWIAKFGANSSLAVPMRDPKTNHSSGVFAVSTADFIEKGDSLWQTMTDLGRELGASDI